MVEYKYNAWGSCIITNVSEEAISGDLGHKNPFRYRGYYYSDDLGLYYLKSRFYDPEVGRFISADTVDYLAPDTVNGLNLYAYCLNNPIIGYDPNGKWDWTSFLKKALGVIAGIGLLATAVAGVILSGGAALIPIIVGAGLGIAANVIGQGVGNILSGHGFFDNFSFSSALMSGLAGAAFATGLGGLWGAVAIGAAANSGTAALQNKSWTQIGFNAIVGGVSAGIGFGIGRFVSNKVFNTNDLGFSDFYQLTILDGGVVQSIATAFRSSWYTFLPNLSTTTTRALSKYLGNKGFYFL